MTTPIRLSVETEQRLNFLALQTGRSKSFFLREIIDRGVDDIEDYYLSIEVLKRIRSGKERAYTSAEVKRGIGLDN